MRKKFQLLTVITAFMLVSTIATPASGQSLTLSGLAAERAAGEQPHESRFKAIPGAAADRGTIAYVKRSTDDIHVISPDGTGDRVLWTIPPPFVYPAYDLAWRPDGRGRNGRLTAARLPRV